MPTHTQPERYPELDALRGLAASVVLLRHFVNIWPYEAMGPYFFILLRSPLRFFFAAHEAVLLFFLLSGFVLTLPFMRRQPSYPAYLIRRTCRIYLPYLVALSLALTGALLLNGSIQPLSNWFNLTWTTPVTPQMIAQHVLFIGSYPNGEVNTAFWSLVYEMRISIIFPLLFALTVTLRPSAAIVVAFGLSILANGFRSDPYTGGWWITVHFASFFLLGSLMAQNLPAIQSFYKRLSSRMLVAINIMALLLVTYGAGPPMLKNWLGDLTDWATMAGLVWIIVLATSSGTLRRFLLLPLPQFLGRISYSLYLIHATVLFALVHVFYGHVALIALLPAYIVLSIGLATLMHRYIELPTMAQGKLLAARFAY
ncbi:acyltransferase family protein [Brucella tritici]|uniref:acyltransferase family protein n=1 Tax=Brucella tritici TaxID=94626 RepID=UPI00158FFAC8|nr:acyltransferase [Brucella tritici]